MHYSLRIFLPKKLEVFTFLNCVILKKDRKVIVIGGYLSKSQIQGNVCHVKLLE